MNNEKYEFIFKVVLNSLREYKYNQELIKKLKIAEENKLYLYMIEQRICFKCLNKINTMSSTTYDDDFTNCGDFVCCNLCARIINNRIDSNYKGNIFLD